MKTRTRNGAVMIVVVGFLTVLMLLGTGYLYAVRRQAGAGDNHRLAVQLLYIAEAGATRALARLADDTTWHAGFTDEPFEGGGYTVAVSSSGTDLRIVSTGRLAGLRRDVTRDAVTTPGVYAPFTCVLFAEGNIDFNILQDPGGPVGRTEVRGNVACNGNLRFNPFEIDMRGDATDHAGYDPVTVDFESFRAEAEGAGTAYSGDVWLRGDHNGDNVIFVDGNAYVCNWKSDSDHGGVDTKIRTLVATGNVTLATLDQEAGKKLTFDPKDDADGILRPAIVCGGDLRQVIYEEAEEDEPPVPLSIGEYDDHDVAPIEVKQGIVHVGGSAEWVWVNRDFKLKTCLYAAGNIDMCIRRDEVIEFDGSHLTDVTSYPPAFEGTEVGGSVRAVAWR